MISWLFVITISILLAFISSKYSRSLNRSEYALLLALILGWFVSFGGKALTDQISYYQFYNSISGLSISESLKLLLHHFNLIERKGSFEFGYLFLNVLFSRLGFGYLGFLFIYSFILNYLLFSEISRHKRIVLITMVFLSTSLFVQQANLIRQMMVVSIFVYSIKYIKAKDLLRYTIIILISTTIHMSALILLPVYFLVNKIYNKYVIFATYLLSLILHFVQIRIGLLDSLTFIYYDLKLERIGRTEEDIFNIAINLLFIASLLFIDRSQVIGKKYNIHFNLFFFGIIISNLVTLGFGFYRVSLYFIMFSIFIIPSIPDFFSENKFLIHYRLNKYKYLISVFLYLYYGRILLKRVFVLEDATLGTLFYSVYELFK